MNIFEKNIWKIVTPTVGLLIFETLILAPKKGKYAFDISFSYKNKLLYTELQNFKK